MNAIALYEKYGFKKVRRLVELSQANPPVAETTPLEELDIRAVANLFDIIIGTHKFEEHYNDSLAGALPEAAERYKAWSPVFHADQIKDPLAVFQGADDKVVPPEHSEAIVAALRANHIPHIYKLYAGEGHGFRKTETIIDFYESLGKFLKQCVVF